MAVLRSKEIYKVELTIGELKELREFIKTDLIVAIKNSDMTTTLSNYLEISIIKFIENLDIHKEV